MYKTSRKKPPFGRFTPLRVEFASHQKLTASLLSLTAVAPLTTAVVTVHCVGFPPSFTIKESNQPVPNEDDVREALERYNIRDFNVRYE